MPYTFKCSDVRYILLIMCSALLMRALSSAIVSFEWWGLAWQSWTSTAGDAGSVPCQGSKTVHIVWPRIKKQTNQKAQKREWRKSCQDFTVANSLIFVWLICSSFGVSTISFFFFFFFKCVIGGYLLYNIVLVSAYINTNQP